MLKLLHHCSGDSNSLAQRPNDVHVSKSVAETESAGRKSGVLIQRSMEGNR
jgi:hypothetical protein